MASRRLIVPLAGRVLQCTQPKIIQCSYSTLRPQLQSTYPSRSSTIRPTIRWSSSVSSKQYSYKEVASLSQNPKAGRVIIDVREPGELESTGHIPTARNLPITSSPEGLFLPADEFENKFGWPKPTAGDELVFYCKAGVRSRAAAEMARAAGWKSVGEYGGSWLDWVENGGEREGGRGG